MTNEREPNKESEFNITPDQISITGLQILEKAPHTLLGGNELLEDDLLSAIFYSLVKQHKLPWDDNLEKPDWNDPRVSKLFDEFNECLRKNKECETIEAVEAQCTTKDCLWKATGQASVDKVDRVLLACKLTYLCREHHVNIGLRWIHNQFLLFKNDKQVGRASVSSAACTGYLES